MSVDWERIAKEFWDEQPHPRGHGLKIKDFPVAVKLASMLKFGGHAEGHEASLFWREFAPNGVPMMPPDEFEHALEHIAPLSFVFHGRPPTLREIGQLAGKASHEVRRYFADLPDKHHPDMTAGEMTASLAAARPWAREHLGREPEKNEARYLHYNNKEAPSLYYERLKQQNTPQQQDELQATVGRDGGGRELGTAGRPALG